jgi:hypothetical protein
MGKEVFVKKVGILMLFSALVFLGIHSVFAAAPYGATPVGLANYTALGDDPSNISASAGNISEVSIYGLSTTQSWQGYFGNVTGAIQLADGNDNVMYNWSVASPEGEIYASTNGTIVWTNIQCFNFTANGTYEDDSAQRGGTSKAGMNMTQLEAQFNMDFDDIDGVNETFTLNDHAEFYTNNLQFTGGECKNTKLYNNEGVGTFDEVLLYSPESKAVVFTSILLDNAMGFNDKTSDFEMLVLEDGHDGDIALTSYFFYVELQ